MLILTRRLGETIVIDDNVLVTILGVKGSQVRLGINAPTDISVNRQEIQEKIDALKRSGQPESKQRKSFWTSDETLMQDE